MEKFTTVSGTAAPLLLANINTDAISPMAAGRSAATDLGAMLFANWRYDADGRENPDFVLNKPPFRHSVILVAGTNFGCGSSRERAVWSLMRFGLRCIIAPSFGEIFHENALQNGLLPVVLPADECASLGHLLETSEGRTVTVDLERGLVERPDGRTIAFHVSPERRAALLKGLDEIDVILGMLPDIGRHESADRSIRPWIFLDRPNESSQP
jgi:3-isopropylmalate/(R)-2-methylmalate dehydratase small subunit